MNKHSNIQMRDDTAKQIRNVRKILRANNGEVDNEPSDRGMWIQLLRISLIIGCLLAILFLIRGCDDPAWSQEIPSALPDQYTNIQYVNAIYKAEGGIHAQYPYGIRSVTCQDKGSCFKVCLRTVQNNRKRFREYGYKKYSRFIEFLGNRFCPTKGGSLSQRERKLNQYWVKNLSYFLGKES